MSYKFVLLQKKKKKKVPESFGYLVEISTNILDIPINILNIHVYLWMLGIFVEIMDISWIH